MAKGVFEGAIVLKKNHSTLYALKGRIEKKTVVRRYVATRVKMGSKKKKHNNVG